MPAYPRRRILGRGADPIVHCWNRCVRRAYLCGRDRLSGRSFEHRRDWIIEVEGQLAELFAIEIEFRAEMQNHFHVVLRPRSDIASRWTREQIVIRWLKIAKLKRGSSMPGSSQCHGPAGRRRPEQPTGSLDESARVGRRAGRAARAAFAKSHRLPRVGQRSVADGSGDVCPAAGMDGPPVAI